jgi:hypothetical protein
VAPHSAPVEWWYFSGRLSGKDAKGHGHSYGYEHVIFQLLGLGPKPVCLGNMSNGSHPQDLQGLLPRAEVRQQVRPARGELDDERRVRSRHGPGCRA